MNDSRPDFGIDWPGQIVILGFGSIGSAVLPLLRRHCPALREPLTVIDPDGRNRAIAEACGARFLAERITVDNHRQVLGGLLAGRAPAMLVNLSTEVSTVDLVRLCRELGVMYLDTVTEPWPGFYFDERRTLAERSNYALREAVLALRGECAGGPTAISCCGANPGMVSWLVKQALLDIARATSSQALAVPADRAGWARLMMQLGVKGVHIAERDGQRAAAPRAPGCFVNTWSVQGLIAEAVQPVELGWGTHEGALPPDAHEHATGCGAAVWLERAGGTQRVLTWTPTAGAHPGYVISHNEAISIADHFTLLEGGQVRYRPTCLYAYRPTDLTVDSLEEYFAGGRQWPRECRVLAEADIAGGVDELGVLLYGHGRNACWYGSRLDIRTARALAPHQNATGLQVSSAVIAAIAWAVANPRAGLVEADDMDFAFCLRHQAPYLGELGGHFTDWQPPLRAGCTDPWSFANMRLA